MAVKARPHASSSSATLLAQYESPWKADIIRSYLQAGEAGEGRGNAMSYGHTCRQAAGAVGEGRDNVSRQVQQHAVAAAAGSSSGSNVSRQVQQQQAVAGTSQHQKAGAMSAGRCT